MREAAKGYAELRRIEDLPLEMREHAPQAVQRRRRQADAEAHAQSSLHFDRASIKLTLDDRFGRE